jgi:hypothetical protein
MRHRCPDSEDYFAIHEYYEADEILKSPAWTRDPIDVGGSSIESLRWTLNRMKAALKEPVLDYPDEQA